jgi:hypothetical protein
MLPRSESQKNKKCSGGQRKSLKRLHSAKEIEDLNLDFVPPDFEFAPLRLDVVPGNLDFLHRAGDGHPRA